MKKRLSTILLVIIHLCLNAQTKEELLQKKLFIQNQITNFTSQLDSINELITDFEAKELEARSLKLNCIISKNTYLNSKPDFSGEKVIDVVAKDTVVLLDITQSDYLYVAFNGRKGYLLKSEVENNSELRNIIQIKKRLYEQKIQIKDSLTLDSLKKQIIIKDAQYIQKYGKELGILILQKKVKIGMTTEMCIKAWGKPNDINRTTGSWGTHEQWVYDNDCYLYFENGILTTIQN